MYDSASSRKIKTGEFELTRPPLPHIAPHPLAPAPKSRPDRKAPKRTWGLGAIVVSSAALAAGAGVVARHGLQPSHGAPPLQEQTETPRTVKIDRPSPAGESSVVLPATFRPWQTTTLHARVDGYLRAWHRDLGASVKAGDLLAEIETPELDQELAEGEALAREAAAAAVQAQAELVEARADLQVAESQLARIEAESKLVKSQLVRREKLVATRAIAQEEYDTFFRQSEARTAEVEAAKSDVARRRSNLQTRAAIIEVREATANSRRANVARLQELQTFKRIVAPFDGVVMRRTAEVGMLVTAGQESLFVIEDTSKVRVQINVPQTYAMQTRPGVRAIINLPDSSFAGVDGEITRIAESVDSVSRTMLAEIELENASRRLQPGSYAQVTLSMPQSGEGWTIPTNTISMRVEGPHVAVVNEEDRIELKPIALGRDFGPRVAVIGGIQGKERLVVNPSEDLVSGVRVQISNTPAAEEVAKR